MLWSIAAVVAAVHTDTSTDWDWDIDRVAVAGIHKDTKKVIADIAGKLVVVGTDTGIATVAVAYAVLSEQALVHIYLLPILDLQYLEDLDAIIGNPSIIGR